MSAVPTTSTAKRSGNATVITLNNLKFHGSVSISAKDQMIDMLRDDGKRITMPMHRLHMIEWDFEE